MEPQQVRVALLTNIVPPYRVPVYRALADTPGWRLRVFTNAETEFDRSWQVDTSGLDVERVPSLSLVSGERTLHLPWALPPALARFTPDVLISAELGPRTLLAWVYGAVARTPLVTWIETTPQRVAEGGALRRALGPWLLARSGSVVGPGSAARRVARSFGMPDRRILDAPNAHDTETFDKRLAALDRDAVARDLRAGLGTRPRVALVVGRLFDVKGVVPLLEAWDRVPSALRREWTLLFVGSGPLAARVAHARDTHQPGEIVHLPALQPAEVVPFYAASDMLVFPSLGDVWGFAVNEAMASGLPVLCSTRAGCAADLIRPGRNGWLADPLAPDAFAQALGEAMTCGRRRVLGDRARESVARFTPAATAAGVRRAVAHALLRASS
jgi:glycosyltransferase involved in cell wall biosynthesis